MAHGDGVAVFYGARIAGIATAINCVLTPVTEIAAAELIPATVMVLEVIWVETAASIWSVKENASGSESE